MKSIIKSKLLLLLTAPLLVLAQQTSYDSDGDGIPDSTDQCVLLKGTTAFKGCPYAKKITKTDRDGDGLSDVQDQCPDMFGLSEHKGCPNVKTISPAQQQGSLSPHNSLFNTVSSLSKEDDETFKEVLLRIVGDSTRPSVSVSGDPYAKDEDKLKARVCLPGALECYIKGDTKTFYADFGIYSEEAPAAAKYYILKQKLTEALGEANWNAVETTSAGYIDKYQLTKRGNSSRAPVVAMHVQKRNDTYAVYITVEQK